MQALRSTSAAPRAASRPAVPARRCVPVCKASAAPPSNSKQAATVVAAGLAALVLAGQPAMALTPTVGGKIGEGATLRGNNGFERQDVMRDFQQRIAERAGKLPKAPDSPPVRPPLGGTPY